MSKLGLDEKTASVNCTIKRFEKIRDNLPKDLVWREGKLFKKFRKDRSSPIKKLKKLYAFIDELYGFVSKYTICSKGCSHCCYYPVNISIIEVEYIRYVTGLASSDNLPSIAITGLNCPFLQNNQCQIYEARPFVCRRHVTLDDSTRWCLPDQSNIVELKLLNFSEIDKAYGLIVSESNDIIIKDIREYFLPMR